MMSAAQNDLITRTGKGTPAGALMRRYWQPAALVDELAGERPVRKVRLMGEDFVLFRDERGRLGLLDRHCPHRGADLAFGRREDGGLRCAFHGWLFDVEGKCLETPAGPEGSTLCQHIRQGSYPVVERSGILWAYLGPGKPPAFPDFDCFIAPGSHSFAFKGLIECNWLQSLEVGIDPVHASFLHRFFADEDPAASYGRPFRGTSENSALPITRLLREFTRPRIELETTDWGFRLFTLREIDKTRTHGRVTNLVFPNAFVIPMNEEMTISQWHVPVDDVTSYWYAIFTSFGGAVDKAEMRRQRLELYKLPDYKPWRNRSNDWGFDATEQREATYTGMGADINVHDQWAIESMGAIQDRTREHLGTTDKAIAAYRRLLLRAIDEAGRGEAPLMVLDDAAARRLTGPAAFDAIGPTGGWESYWRELDAHRRKSCSWTARRDFPLPSREREGPARSAGR
jgi:phenylpropionate dioxygenase-like ring-hydroxylating dioxygenase large terminal subunit